MLVLVTPAPVLIPALALMPRGLVLVLASGLAMALVLSLKLVLELELERGQLLPEVQLLWPPGGGCGPSGLSLVPRNLRLTDRGYVCPNFDMTWVGQPLPVSQRVGLGGGRGGHRWLSSRRGES
jgi:hypothetical protein